MIVKRWYSKEGDREDIKAQLVAATPALKRLRAMLLDDLKNIQYNQRKPDYDCSNWALKQADAIGGVRTLKEVIDLITIEEPND